MYSRIILSYSYYIETNNIFFYIRKVIQNKPLPLTYPKEFNDGLWGGEAIVRGFQ